MSRHHSTITPGARRAAQARLSNNQPTANPLPPTEPPAGPKRPFTGVLGLYDGVDNGCSFYRMIQPFSELNSFGLPMEWMSMGDVKPDPTTGQTIVKNGMSNKNYSIVSLLRPVVTVIDEAHSPVTPLTIEVMEGLINNVHSSGALFCGDLDDDMWAVEKHNPAHEELGEYTPDRIKETLKRLDFVTCSTPHLGARIAKVTGLDPDRINVIPNMIDFTFYDRDDWELPVPGKPGENQLVSMSLVRRNRMLLDDPNRPIVIGLQGGLSHVEDWRIVSPALKRVAERYGEKIRIVIAGAHFDYMQEDLAQATERGLVWWKPWTSFMIHSETIMQFDINLCPLEDTLFNHSKSGIKWMEASAAGAATIASPTVYANYIQPGKTGLIARTALDWEEALCHLIENSGVRRFLARNAHLVVRSHHNLETGVYLWNNVYNLRWQELGSKVNINYMEQYELAEMLAMQQNPFKASHLQEAALAG